tara:strand:+ start:464 stop:577 length:114 start_codon:yes stop_codon:yes gene_type:complete
MALEKQFVRGRTRNTGSLNKNPMPFGTGFMFGGAGGI